MLTNRDCQDAILTVRKQGARVLDEARCRQKVVQHYALKPMFRLVVASAAGESVSQSATLPLYPSRSYVRYAGQFPVYQELTGPQELLSPVSFDSRTFVRFLYARSHDNTSQTTPRLL
jgi:hypothetical protein